MELMVTIDIFYNMYVTAYISIDISFIKNILTGPEGHEIFLASCGFNGLSRVRSWRSNNIPKVELHMRLKVIDVIVNWKHVAYDVYKYIPITKVSVVGSIDQGYWRYYSGGLYFY